jgi:hypothetical protein
VWRTCRSQYSRTSGVFELMPDCIVDVVGRG